jgi:hypothetical protein
MKSPRWRNQCSDRDDAQQAMRDHVQACGFNYLCTDNVDKATDWLKQHGILRGSEDAPCGSFQIGKRRFSSWSSR